MRWRVLLVYSRMFTPLTTILLSFRRTFTTLPTLPRSSPAMTLTMSPRTIVQRLKGFCTPLHQSFLGRWCVHLVLQKLLASVFSSLNNMMYKYIIKAKKYSALARLANQKSISNLHPSSPHLPSPSNKAAMKSKRQQFQLTSVIMQNYQTADHIESIVTQLLDLIDAEIDLRVLMKSVPSFTAMRALRVVTEISLLQLFPTPMDRLLAEDNLADIPRIEKDALMPKDLSLEKVRVQSPRRTSPRSSVSSMRKIAFKKRQSSVLVDKLQPVMASERKPGQRPSKNAQHSVYQPLTSEENHEEQEMIDHMRGRTETRLQYFQSITRIKQEREKIFQSKLNELNHIIHEDPKANITYDYEGDAFKSNKEEHENLRLNMTRTGIGFAAKKLKEGVKFIAPEESKVEVRQRITKSLKEQFNGPLKPLQMPLFPMKYQDGLEIKNLKLEQYKKFYGHKYSRLDHRNHTIDMNSTAKTIQKQQVFIDKKHFKDADNEEHSIAVKGRATYRKLALPKLNGKYKVLDRYEE